MRKYLRKLITPAAFVLGCLVGTTTGQVLFYTLESMTVTEMKSSLNDVLLRLEQSAVENP